MMQLSFSFLIRCASFFWRVKQTKAYSLVVNFYARLPLAVFAPDARKSACVFGRFPPVMRIGNVGGFSQVSQSVVCAVIVDVVNLIRRPYAMCVKPRKAMRAVQNIVYTNADIPVLHQTPSHGTLTAFSPGHSPLKNPRIRVIADKFFQAVRCKFGHFNLQNTSPVYINSAACGGQA